MFNSNQPDIRLAARSWACRMTYEQAVELAFVCGAVEQDQSVTFEILQDTRMAGKPKNHIVVRKQFNKFTHYVQPMWNQSELIEWQRKINSE